MTDCFKGRGKPTSEQRSLSPFLKIEVYDKIDLIIIKDSLHPEHMEINGWKNLLSSISTNVKDGILAIHDNNTCNFVRDLDNRTTVKVYIHSINSLEIHDVATAKTEGRLTLDSMLLYHEGMSDISMDLNIGRLTCKAQSGGNIKLNGYAAIFVAVLNDVGGIDASGLQGDYTFVFHNGTNDCLTMPYKVLDVNITYSGNVYYDLEPILEKKSKISGSGRIIKQ